MSLKSCVYATKAAVLVGLVVSTASAQISIPVVQIGSPGNAADASTGYGSVPYSYNIGATEVTNAQYASFLNAIARFDGNSLYHPNMAGPLGGIVRTGISGAYRYTPVNGRANHPVNFVSFWSATRFANWLHNGQPTGFQDVGTTETGAYTLTPSGITQNSVQRNSNWQWAVTSEDEWYKAAFFQPASAGGDRDNYWQFATSSNDFPVPSRANINDAIGNTTPVGAYAANHFGAFDLGGNVWEWNESQLRAPDSTRGWRGGSFRDIDLDLRASVRRHDVAFAVGGAVGFRVVQIPTPSSLIVMVAGGLIATRRHRSDGRNSQP
jgi:formylglycine-generating enzyme